MCWRYLCAKFHVLTHLRPQLSFGIKQSATQTPTHHILPSVNFSVPQWNILHKHSQNIKQPANKKWTNLIQHYCSPENWALSCRWAIINTKAIKFPISENCSNLLLSTPQRSTLDGQFRYLLLLNFVDNRQHNSSDISRWASTDWSVVVTLQRLRQHLINTSHTTLAVTFTHWMQLS